MGQLRSAFIFKFACFSPFLRNEFSFYWEIALFLRSRFRLNMPVYFLKLDFFSIFPMLLLKIVGYRIFFLDCGEFWKREGRYRRIAHLGINWISHQEGDTARFGTIMHDCHSQILLIGNQLMKSDHFNALVEPFGRGSNLSTCVYELVHTIIRQPLELIHTGQSHRSNTPNETVRLWFPNTRVTRMLLHSFPRSKNLCPRPWSAIELMLSPIQPVLNRATALAASRLRCLIRRFAVCVQSVPGGKNSFPPREQGASFLQAVKVAFFPHRGVMYGSLYAKDHFYATDTLSPFNPGRIAHFESVDADAAGSLEYYKRHGIRNFEWKSLPFDRSKAFRSVRSYMRNGLCLGWPALDCEIFLKFARICWNIETARGRLAALPNLKLVLVGSDLAFPQTLAVACHLSQVKTVATQERMVSAWWMHPLLFDHYLIAGPASHKYLMSILPESVQYHLLGPIRMDKHRGAVIPEIAKVWRTQYRALVLALDMHSEKGEFENGRALGNNWRINSRFYRDILGLTEHFPDYLFLLKGKNVDFLEIAYFKEIVQALRSRPNFLVLEDGDQWTPFNSVAVADVCLARHTSLADEMLALGKPVVFHDTYGFPSEVFDYGSAVTRSDLEGLKLFFEQFRVDNSTLENIVENIRSNLFADPAAPLQEVIQAILEAALDQHNPPQDSLIHSPT